MMIYILYSADYELFLGSNLLSEEEVLIQPTGQLLRACERLHIPLTLFADMACLWRYRELGHERFPERACLQLQNAVLKGHDVQTHLHPHWAFTRFAGNAFLFDPATYLLGTMNPDPEQRFQLTKKWLRQAAESLTELLRPLAPDYQCLAFRAGGYGLQPDERMILRALRETGYRIDSSIIPGARLTTPVQQVDFRQVPNQPNYWLSEEQGLTGTAPPGTGLFEIPIASCHLNARDRLAIQLPEAIQGAWQTLRGDSGPPPRGTPCNLPSGPQTGSRLKKAYWRARALLDVRFRRLELGHNPRALLTCVERYLTECHARAEEKPIFLSLNCHPKGLQPDHLQSLERFHAGLLRRWPQRVQAITFGQAWQRIQEIPS